MAAFRTYFRNKFTRISSASRSWIFIGLLVGVFLAGLKLVRWLKIRSLQNAKKHTPEAKINLRKINGLSEVEADERKIEGQDNTLYFKPRRTRREIWRENVLSIFNLSLVGLAGVQLLFGRPQDALLSIGVLALNIGLNVFQESFARMRIKDLLQKTHPRVTVIRDGKTRSIDANDIVVDDMVAFGPGDELLADGMLVHQDNLVIEESMLGVGDRRAIKEDGELVFAGSFCVSGRAVYQVQKVGRDRFITTLIEDSPETKERLTPIEKVVNNVLRILLVVVAIFTVLLISTYLNLDLPIPEELYNEIAGIIFGLAPAGLYFMIIVTYAASTADIAKIGALVNRARSVETMAQVNTICFSREGILTGFRVDMEAITGDDEEESFTESRISQILGDYARSTNLDNQLIRSMANSFEGNLREAVDEAPFLSVYGWNALTFEDPDLEGVFVLGAPAALEPYLTQGGGYEDLTTKDEPNQVRKVFSRFGGLFSRSDQNPDENNDSENGAEIPTEPSKQDAPAHEDPVDAPPTDEASQKRGFFRRMLTRFTKSDDVQSLDEEKQEAQAGRTIELLFTYYPDPSPIFDESGKPQFPTPLIPLCTLTFDEQLRPDAVEGVKKFVRSGIGIKIFTDERPQQVANLLARVGLQDMASNMVSGDELSSMGKEDRTQAALDNATFLQLTPQQMGEVVKDLRSSGEYVAVIGNSVNDVPAMRAANLSLAHQRGSQAAQSVADILLLENSPGVIEKVLDKGQRIVNGLLDILKLYLTQVFYLTLLIIAIQLVGFGFPFRGIQLTVISVVTITIPSLGLTLWAQSGVLYGKSLRKSLTHFVLPTSLTISIAATFIFFYFKNTTGDNEYTHLTITYALVFIGLIVVLFLRPPTRILSGGAPVSDDRRISMMVLVLFVLFFVTVAITVAVPFLQETLLLDWLNSGNDYLVIALVVIVWAISLLVIWRIWRLDTTENSENENELISASQDK
jgi:cation-transporting ATPase E